MHHLSDPVRVTAMCTLIFIVCAGLGTAGFWTTTRTEELVTLREARMVVRALGASSVAALLLLWVTPDRMTFKVALFFMVYAVIVTVMLIILHWRIHKSRKEVDHYE